MKITIDDHFLNKYSGSELEKAKEICAALEETSAYLEEHPQFNLDLEQLKILERLASRSDAPDMDLFYVYCQGFFMGRKSTK